MIIDFGNLYNDVTTIGLGGVGVYFSGASAVVSGTAIASTQLGDGEISVDILNIFLGEP